MRVSSWLRLILAMLSLVLAGCLTEPVDVGHQEQAATDLAQPLDPCAPQVPLLGTGTMESQVPDVRPEDLAHHSIVNVFPIYEATEEIAPGIFRWDLFGFREEVWLYHEEGNVHEVHLHGTLAYSYLNAHAVSMGPYNEQIPWAPGGSGWEMLEFLHRYSRALGWLDYFVVHYEDGQSVRSFRLRFSGPLFGAKPEIPPVTTVSP